MSDYISRQVAIKAIKGHINFVNADMEGYNMARRQMMELIELLPAADVRENVRGEWIFPYGDKKYKRCSVCGSVFYSIPYNTNFCPNCGADMRGES